MMSDPAGPTFKQGEGLGLVFSNINDNSSSHPYMGKGMAHWIQACRNSSSKGCENHNAAIVGSIVDQFNEHDFLAVERVKFKEVKFLSFDINQSYNGGYMAKLCFAADTVDLVSHAIQSDETTQVGCGNYRITDNSTLRRNVKLFDDEITFLERVSTGKLSESSIKWKTSASYHFQNIDSYGSEIEHFPIFDINRKIETIMDSRKKTDHGAMFVKMKKGKLPVCESPAISNLVELAPGSWHAAKNMIDNTGNVMRPCEGLQLDYTLNAGRTSFPAIHGCKCQNTNTTSCIFNCGLADKVPTNTKLSCMQRKLWCCSSNNKFMNTVTKNNVDSMSTSLGIPWGSLKDGSTLVFRESSPNGFPCLLSTEEHNNDVKDDSSNTNRLLVGQKRLSQRDDSDAHLWPSKIPKFRMQEVSQPVPYRNLKSVESGEGFHKLSSIKNSLLVADEMVLDQGHRELMMGDSAFTIVNDTALSKKFVTPTKQIYGEKETTTVPFGNFTNVENMRGPGGIGTPIMGAHNEFSTKDDAVYHSPHTSSSLVGKTFSRPPTCVASPNQRKSNRTSSSPAAEAICRSLETGATDRSEQPGSTKRTSSVSIKKIADMTSSSNLKETCRIWVKRLQHNKKHSESLSVYNTMSHDAMEEHKFEEDKTISESNRPSIGDIEEGLQSWIRRWRCNHHQTSPSALRPVVAFQPSEKFEGKKFASIGAMALMGKVVNKYRPCRIRRKDASFVWTT